MKQNLTKFIEAQKNQYSNALNEIKNGKKSTHWMWYIFPQIAGLGFSSTAIMYEIKDKDEACQYLNDETLANRLIEITEVLNNLKVKDANKIFGFPDELKLKSSMTLFYVASNKSSVFKTCIDNYFDGELCAKTMQLLNQN